MGLGSSTMSEKAESSCHWIYWCFWPRTNGKNCLGSSHNLCSSSIGDIKSWKANCLSCILQLVHFLLILARNNYFRLPTLLPLSQKISVALHQLCIHASGSMSTLRCNLSWFHLQVLSNYQNHFELLVINIWAQIFLLGLAWWEILLPHMILGGLWKIQ